MGRVRFTVEGDHRDLHDLLQTVAHALSSSAYPPHMVPVRKDTPGTESVQTPVAPGTAGRIERATNSLVAGVDAWCLWMEDRRKKPASIAAFRDTIERAILDEGWNDVRHLTYASITAWLGRTRTERKWKASTYNRHLAAFRALGKYLAATDLLPKNPMALAIDADADAAPGSRALTIDEARAIIRTAMQRTRTDGRAVGNRALYWYIIFACGLRVNEPSLWKWGQLFLDPAEGGHPSILWLPENHKNRSRVEVALSEEAARLLRTHRETVPHAKDDPVFPLVPPRTTFRVDRDRAGVDETDRLGMRCSPHSSRKSFETWAIAAGINPRMVDYLMRHKAGIGDTYHKPLLSDQAAALAKMPLLWPENDGGQVTENTPNRGNFPSDDFPSENCLTPHGMPDSMGGQDRNGSGAKPQQVWMPRAASSTPVKSTESCSIIGTFPSKSCDPDFPRTA